MIVNTVIDPAAIREAVASSHDGGKEALVRLATEMRRHGAISLARGSDENGLRQALDPVVGGLKLEVANLWVELLRDLRRWGRLIDQDVTQAGSNFDALTSAGSISHLTPAVELAIVKREFATGPGMAPGHVCLASPEQVDRSPVIGGLRKMKYAENYAKKSDSNRIWEERFAPCAKISKTITLVDHYLFGGKDGINKHLMRWVLDRLNQAEVPPTLKVELIGALPNNTRMNDIRDILADLDFCKSPRFLSVWVVPDWRGGPHNRHIRFSCSTAFTVEEGFARFVSLEGKPEVWGISGVTPHYVAGADPLLARLKQSECGLKRSTPARYHFEL